MAFGVAANAGLQSVDPFIQAKEKYELRNLEQFGTPIAPGSGLNKSRNKAFDLQSLMAQLVGQAGSANEANIQRRDDINAMFGQRSANAQSALTNLGTSETRRLEESAQMQQADSQQNLTSRGLTGTTLLSSNNNAINRNKDTAISDLNQNIALQKFGTGDNILNQQQQFNERITDQGPDLSQLLPLLMQLNL